MGLWTSQEIKVTTCPRCECLTGSSDYTLMWHHSVREEVVRVCFQRITAAHLSHAHVGLLVCLSVYYAKAVPTQRQYVDLQILHSLLKGGILLNYSSYRHHAWNFFSDASFGFSYVISDFLKAQVFDLF